MAKAVSRVVEWAFHHNSLWSLIHGSSVSTEGMSTPHSHNPNTDPIGENPFIFIDKEDVVWSWDFTKNQWFVFDEDDLEMPGQKRMLSPSPVAHAGDAEAQKPVSKKKKIVDTRPATVYVDNLPSDTTAEEIYTFFSKAGIIKRDEFTGEFAIKIYENEDGTQKGDAIVTYFKPESLPLALQLLDGADFRFKTPIKVTEVCFSDFDTINSSSNELISDLHESRLNLIQPRNEKRRTKRRN